MVDLWYCCSGCFVCYCVVLYISTLGFNSSCVVSVIVYVTTIRSCVEFVRFVIVFGLLPVC